MPSNRLPTTALTLDVDWAPDFVIDFVADILVDHAVKCTWFVTHASPAVDRLRHFPDLFELGVHPNFLPGSTQGKTPAEVLAFCRELVPDARSMRTHSLVQSSPLLAEVMNQRWIARDVSLFLPYHPNLQPVLYRWGGRDLWRVPYFWEDDFEMERRHPNWDLCRLFDRASALAVLDFHPIHVFLNSANIQRYQALKQAAPNLMHADEGTVTRFVQRGPGARTAFVELVERLAQERGKSAMIAEIPVAEQQAEGVAA